MNSIWKKYQSRVLNTILGENLDRDELDYWRDRLFAQILIWFLPFSFLTIIPGISMWLNHGFILLPIVAFLRFVIVLGVSLVPGISNTNRKILLIGSIYMVTTVLLSYYGLLGPGFIYLFGTTVLAALILPKKFAMYTVGFNAAIIGLISTLLFFGGLDDFPASGYPIVHWVVISLIMVFLSWVFALAIPTLFLKLQKHISNEEKLKRRMKEDQAQLWRTLGQLKQKTNELEEINYITSHDLQEPMRNIKGLLNFLEKKMVANKESGQQANEIMQHIGSLSDRMSRQIHSLLEYSRIGRNSNPKRVFLSKVVEETITEFSEKTNCLKARIEVENELEEVIGYSYEIKQLLTHLIDNALKFRKVEDEPQIFIGSKEKTNGIVLYVKDNGMGIEADYHQKIFGLFQRLNPLSQYKGAGIGLAHCKKIAELHGGKIWVESKLGSGSVFYVFLPKTQMNYDQ